MARATQRWLWVRDWVSSNLTKVIIKFIGYVFIGYVFNGNAFIVNFNFRLLTVVVFISCLKGFGNTNYIHIVFG
jgi:primase-polymerase (primpol)-like protein